MVAVEEDTVAAWPNQAEAARMLSVHETTLFRSGLDLRSVAYGGKEKRISPDSVLLAAAHFKRKPVREVASALVELAERKAPAYAEAVSREVDAFLDRREQDTPRRQLTADELLIDLAAALPHSLFRQIEKVYRQTAPPGETASSPTADRDKVAARTPRKRRLRTPA